MARRLFIGWAAAVILLAGAIGAARADDPKKEPKKESKSFSGKPVVAVFRFSSGVSESPADDTFSFGGPTPISLKDLVARLRKAAKDPAVRAVALIAEGGAAGRAQTEELRQAMGMIRSAGKEVFVHADSLSMEEYVLFSGAKISLVPTADLWLTGLHGEAPYIRGLLDKLGIKPDFLTCGNYKSAAEIFMREGPSKEADDMQNWLLNSIYQTEKKLIADGRHVDESEVEEWINNGPYTAEKAKAHGLIDDIQHRQDFESMLKGKYGKDVVFNKKYGKKKMPALDFSSPLGMIKGLGDLFGEAAKPKAAKPAVAIVYVDGAITVGSSRSSPFSSATGAHSTDIRKALDEAARDDSIKAVVLRVDSPGGSAVASEIIYDATLRVKQKKPFVVSMGDVAGSGGYYVACGSDIIFADKSTITGSIGVVGGKIATNDMWKKIGITFKEYKRGKNAGILSTSDVFTKEEREKMQAWMNEVYGVFKKHVTDLRKERLDAGIDELAGGRVWTGEQALKHGLVDKIGTLQDAIDYIADKAKLGDDYEVRIVPEPKNFIEQLVEEFSGAKDEPKELGIDLRTAAGSRPTSLIDLAMPYLQNMDPERVKLIKTALLRLQLIKQEGAVLMMPEIRVGR
jgi:protease IV